MRLLEVILPGIVLVTLLLEAVLQDAPLEMAHHCLLAGLLAWHIVRLVRGWVRHG